MQNNAEYYVNVENSILEDGPTKDTVKSYHGEFKKYKPAFKARPESYYPNTCKSYFIQFFMLVPTWILCGVLLWAFTNWGLVDTDTFGYICIVVWGVYIVIIRKKVLII